MLGARTDSVLAQHAMVGEEGVSLRSTMAGVAAAKRGRARTEMTARRENILESEVCELQRTLEDDLLRTGSEDDEPFIHKHKPSYCCLLSMSPKLQVYEVLHCNRT